MIDYHQLYLQILMYLTTVAQSIRTEIRENNELEQPSFESLLGMSYLKGQIDLLDDIEKTITKLKSQD